MSWIYSLPYPKSSEDIVIPNSSAHPIARNTDSTRDTANEAGHMPRTSRMLTLFLEIRFSQYYNLWYLSWKSFKTIYLMDYCQVYLWLYLSWNHMSHKTYYPFRGFYALWKRVGRWKHLSKCYFFLKEWFTMKQTSLCQRKNKTYFIILCAQVFACMYVCASLLCIMPAKVTRRHQVPWKLSYKWLWVIIWALGIKPGSPVLGAIVLYCWEISPGFFLWHFHTQFILIHHYFLTWLHSSHLSVSLPSLLPFIVLFHSQYPPFHFHSLCILFSSQPPCFMTPLPPHTHKLWGPLWFPGTEKKYSLFINNADKTGYTYIEWN
jgi:hypothetical protein